MKFQVEIRNILLETRGKVILVMKWQRTLLNCGLVFFWKVEFARDKTGYLAKEIFKQIVERAAWFPSLFIVRRK